MTIQPETPSVRERQLALELREARLGAQLPGSETARILGWSASKVSRIETGRIGISPTDLDRLLELYQVPDEQARYLRRLAPAARTRGWWDAYADSLSAGYSGLLRLEAGSQALSCYCAVVPHPAADDTGIRPPGRSGHLAGAIGTRGGPAGSDLRPTPSGHPTPRPAPRPDPQGRHLTGQCRLILRAGIPGHRRPRRRLPSGSFPAILILVVLLLVRGGGGWVSPMT